jgi:small-conductance mechanosensitive channel
VTIASLFAALFALLVAFIIARIVGLALRRVRQAASYARGSLYLVEKLSTYGIVVVGFAVALTTLGLNLSALAIFFGAFGLGIGLGLQGIVKEFVSGLVLIFDRHVNIGDYIELDSGRRGQVQEIGPRATRIRTNDNVYILLPNSTLIENTVVNWTLRDAVRRIHIPFSVAYGTDKTKVRDAVLAAAHSIPFTLPDEEDRKTQVWLVGFGESSLNFELVVWPTLEACKRPAAMHAAYTWAIDDALSAAGIEIPLPQREIRLRSVFGREGDDALATMRLDDHAKEQPVSAPLPGVNDAAEDLQRPPDSVEAPADMSEAEK